MRHSNLDAVAAAAETTVRRLSATDRLPNLPRNLEPLLHAGWDYTADPKTIDDPGLGIWRTPQFVPRLRNPGWVAGRRPILAIGMSVDEIEAGLRRQIRILPLAESERPGCDSKGESDYFATPTGVPGGRDPYLEPFLGVHLRDLAVFLDELSKINPRLARELMSKRFCALGLEFDNLAAIPWPETCHRRFSDRGRDKVIPPVLALVLHAALAQYAQTHAAHLQLAFKKTGEPIGIRELVDDLPTLLSKSASSGTRLVGQFETLQTWGLHGRYELKSRRAVTALRRRLLADCAQFGTMPSGGGGWPKALIKSVRNHPYSLKHRELGPGSQLAKRDAITRYGLTWRDDAAVNLLLIHEQMLEWHSGYAHPVSFNAPFRSPAKLWRPRPLASSIAAASLFWLESNVPNALSSELEQLARSTKIYSGYDIETLCGNCTGEKVLRRARDLVPVLNRPSCLGFSAFAHPRLWLTDHIPDMPEFVRLEALAQDDLLALGRQGGLPPSVFKAMSYSRLGAAQVASKRRGSRRPRNGKVRIAARASQALSMMMHAQATDPMHAVLIRDSLR